MFHNNHDHAFLLPISIGRECDILVHNSLHLRECQRQAYNTWIQLDHEQGAIDWAARHNDDNNRHALLSRDNKSVCCYRWALLDCLTESVRSQCRVTINFDFRRFMLKRDEVVLYYESFHCGHYPFASLKCHLSTWLIVIITLLLILLLLSLGFLAVYNFNLHRKRKRLPVTDL